MPSKQNCWADIQNRNGHLVHFVISAQLVSCFCSQIQKYSRKLPTLMTTYESYFKFAYIIVHDIVIRRRNFNFQFSGLLRFEKLKVLRYQKLLGSKPHFYSIKIMPTAVDTMSPAVRTHECVLCFTHTRIESHKGCPKSLDANVCGRTAVLAGTASCRCKGLTSFVTRHQYQ